MKLKSKYSDTTLNTLWSKAVKHVAGNKCEYDGREYNVRLHSHHLVRRKELLTRWLVENGVCLCKQCHDICHGLKDYERPELTRSMIEDYIKDKRGHENIYAIERLGNTTFPDWKAKTGKNRNEFTVMKYIELKKVLGETDEA